MTVKLGVLMKIWGSRVPGEEAIVVLWFWGCFLFFVDIYFFR